MTEPQQDHLPQGEDMDLTQAQLYGHERDRDMVEAVRATAASMYGNGPEDEPDQSGLY